MNMICFCGSEQLFSECCEPYILKVKYPSTAEHLMRSRYSAYATKNYQYIYDTYAQKFRADLTPHLLSSNDEHTIWLKLKVMNTVTQSTSASVEFKAFYRIRNQFFVIHENSDFIFEKNQWFYTTGKLAKNEQIPTPPRNELCLCGSKKKFKKCCAK